MGLFSWLFGNGESKTSPAITSHSPKTYRTKSTTARVEWREGSFPMDVVGESNYQSVLQQVCGGHSRYGHEFQVDGELVREPENPYDVNAIAVTIHGSNVGYLPRDQAARVSAQMAEEGIDRAICRAKIVGGWRTNQHDEGSFGVRLAIPFRGWIDFGLGKKAPSNSASNSQPGRQDKPTRPEAAESGPLKGQYVVIWGAPDYGDEAIELENLGAHIMAGVGKSTTMVVQIDEELTPGMKNSSVYKKTQELNSKGINVEIVTLDTLRARFRQPTHKTRSTV